MSTKTEATPGFNKRIGIFFDLDKNGKRRAYRWGHLQFRSFPMPCDEADALIAAGQADHLSCHPIHGPRG